MYFLMSPKFFFLIWIWYFSNVASSFQLLAGREISETNPNQGAVRAGVHWSVVLVESPPQLLPPQPTEDESR